jgi:GntR family transcriptional regulator
VLFRVDAASAVPLGDQIAACVRRALVEGEASPGERLPAARELAASLGVNMHTVLRGYQALRDEGLIELRRGRGAVISGGAGVPRRARLAEAVRGLVAEARELGLSDQEVLALVRVRLTERPGGAPSANSAT